ncbi:hypothetical protein Pint_27034 [Pistacia integerrima]|uniref:Uncharacterized protein n=1 Tax=Pistacia integerrima TaxID=434235 RepID=A0ACC0YU44_9ROSI|nr:hypothetical protein Pint_27034 [Pistacia integerrima]
MQHLLIHAPGFTLQAMTITKSQGLFNVAVVVVGAVVDVVVVGGTIVVVVVTVGMVMVVGGALLPHQLFSHHGEEQVIFSYSSSYTEARFGFEDRAKSYSFNAPSGDNDAVVTTIGNPEMKRRKRVAAYNMYVMEGKFKSSMRNSFKWIKNKFSDGYYDH